MVFQPRDEKDHPLWGDEKTTSMRNGVQEGKEEISIQHLLACLIFEIQVNVTENDPPVDILDTLATLIDHAPPSVMELVEDLRCTPPEDQEEDYPSTLPSFKSGDAFDDGDRGKQECSLLGGADHFLP